MEIHKIVLSLLAVLTSGACMIMLYRGYAKRGLRLLLWSAICFAGLTVNNVVLFCDLVVFPDIDLRPVRLVAGLTGMLCLLYGFIWDSD
jgi:hypothetical protein